MNLSKFSERLSDLMFDAGYNGLSLSQKLDCGYNTIYRYLQGERTPTVEMLVVLADFFNCSIDYLIGLEEENNTCKFNKCPPFKDRLGKLLEKEKISQYRFEKNADIAHSTMGYWKNGKKKPNIDNIIKIANALDCSVDYVLGRTND